MDGWGRVCGDETANQLFERRARELRGAFREPRRAFLEPSRRGRRSSFAATSAPGKPSNRDLFERRYRLGRCLKWDALRLSPITKGCCVNQNYLGGVIQTNTHWILHHRLSCRHLKRRPPHLRSVRALVSMPFVLRLFAQAPSLTEKSTPIPSSIGGLSPFLLHKLGKLRGNAFISRLLSCCR